MVIYIHGFGGSGEGSKAKAFREYFKSIDEDFIAPSLSYVPQLAIKTLEELIESYHGDVYLIGSSLGGYYATYLSKIAQVKKVVLLNPSVNPKDTLQRAIGNAPNFFDESYYNWNQKHLEMLNNYRVNSDIYWYLKYKGLVFLQKGDELLDYNEAVDKYNGIKQIVEDGGSHSFDGIERHFENIRKFFEIGVQFKHTCKVKGIGFELDELANRVGDLYYDDLALFLENLSKKLQEDAVADRGRGRKRLADSLENSASLINHSALEIQNSWKQCEIHTLRWMIDNGFNKHINIVKMDNLPAYIMEWYYGRKITMPEHIIQEIKKYHDKELKYKSENGMMGIKADLYRMQMGVEAYFMEKYPKYEEEIEAIVSKLTKV